MIVRKCVVCNIKFQNIVPNLNFGSQEKVGLIYRKILRIFCSYFNLPQKDVENDKTRKQDYAEITDENGPLFSFPFCSECRNLVAELCIFHEKVEIMQNLVQKTVAKITVKIFNAENEQENSSKSNSMSQNVTADQEEKGGKQTLNYRQKIIQDFSPRVRLTKYKKKNPVPKPLKTNETNGLDLIKNSMDDNSLTGERLHGNDRQNDDNENGASSLATQNREQNLMEKIRSMRKSGETFPLNSRSSSSAETPAQPESFPTGFTRIHNKFIHNSGKWWAELTEFGWKCNSCPKIYPKTSGARNHIENQHVTGKFKCKICPRSFIRESLLKNHGCGFGFRKLKPTVENEVSPGKFKYGGEKTFSASSPAPEKRCQNLMEKIRSMTKTGPKFPFVSELSSFEIPAQSESSSTGFTTIEIKYVHNSGKWWATLTDLGWKCNSCEKLFTNKLGARRHMENQHVVGEFKCKTCPRSFISQSLLKTHCCDFVVEKLRGTVENEVSPGKFQNNRKWEFVEREDGKFQCCTCSRIFKMKGSLVAHIRKNHDSKEQSNFPIQKYTLISIQNTEPLP